MNALYARLITLDNGINTGNTTPDGAVIKDNDDLNVIFEDFDVLYYERAFSTIQNPDLQRVYVASCDCDAGQLKLVLELETETIELVDGPLGYDILDLVSLSCSVFQF
jgi:hypothetical protein